MIVTGLHGRAVKAPRGRSARGRRRSPTTSLAEVGNTGTAHWALLLADVLDRAEPGQQIAVVVLADGCDVRLLRTTDAARPTARPTVGERIAATRDDLDYAQFLTWRGSCSASRRAAPSPIARPPRRRPAPTPGSTPSSAAATRTASSTCRRRASAWASGEIDQMEPVRMADVPATIATFTVDRLAFSLSPPVVAAVIDFDGGGRFQCELTDVDPAPWRSATASR